MTKSETKTGSSSGQSRQAVATVPSATGTAPIPIGTPAAGWQDIKVGSVVVAFENSDDGWWEAVVTAINGDNLTLRWRDYSTQPAVVRSRSQIAFMASAK
jgi:hypothetical protein